MKLTDQYLQAVSQKLPLRGRKDIKAELESLLLDEIENRYGRDATENQVKEVLKSLGSPAEVARRYAGDKPVIAEGLSVMYFFLLKLVLGALSLAFFVISVISFMQGSREPGGIPKLIGIFFANVATGWLSATGAVTLTFIAASHFSANAKIDMDEDWNPDELKSIVLEDAKPTKAESVITMAGLAIVIILMNAFPQVISLAETAFFRTGLAADIGHRIDISVIRTYVIIFTPIWAVQLVCAFLAFRGQNMRDAFKALPVVIELATVTLHIVMVFDTKLYTGYSGIVGFRLLFIIVASIEAIELAARAGKALLGRIAK